LPAICLNKFEHLLFFLAGPAHISAMFWSSGQILGTELERLVLLARSKRYWPAGTRNKLTAPDL